MQDGRCVATKARMPEMRPVESSSVAAVGYDPTARELHVRFKDSGETYVYYGVEAPVFEAFVQADSKGGFVNARLRRRYIARKL
jgi:hypothetical protein